MELEPLFDRMARNLSGGMLRRLEIATALLNRPCFFALMVAAATRAYPRAIL